jgi:sodium/hydrogen antiporter
MGGLTALAVVVVAYTLVASKLDRWWTSQFNPSSTQYSR